MNRPIYLDYNATTPVDPAVVDAMLPFLTQRFGNASSAHAFGYEAHAALDRARDQVAQALGARPDEIVFTGGGSESDNLAIKGAVFAASPPRPHVVSTTVEHPAVLESLRYLERRFGVDVTLLPVDEHGLVDAEQVREALRPETVLVTVMQANNEVGTLQAIDRVAETTRDAGVPLHVDAAQAVGKVAIDVDQMGVDMLTVAGHKLYAPKGVGALYVRRGTRIDPLIHGSAQEGGLRSGTENVAAVVALGAACEIAQARLPEDSRRLAELRDALFTLLRDRIPGIILNGHPVQRLPNTLNVSFPGTTGGAVLACAPEVAASTGAACHSGKSEPSAVLMAMGYPVERALGAVRLSLGRWTTREDIGRAADLLVAGYMAATPSPALQ